MIFACTLSLKQRVRTIMEGNRRMGIVPYGVHDIYPPEVSRERADLQELTHNAAEYARLWIGRGKRAARQGKLLRNDIN
ncbi:unnamed protein product [Prunus brigantina]